MEFKNDLGLVGKIAAHSVMSGKYKDKDGNIKEILPVGPGNSLDFDQFREDISAFGGGSGGTDIDPDHPSAGADYYAGSLGDGEITERNLEWSGTDDPTKDLTVTFKDDPGSNPFGQYSGLTILGHIQKTVMTSGTKGAVSNLELNYDPSNATKDGYFTTTSPYPIYISQSDIASGQELDVPINGIGEGLEGDNTKPAMIHLKYNSDKTMTISHEEGYVNDGSSAGATGANYSFVVEIVATFSTQKAVAQFPESIKLFSGSTRTDKANILTLDGASDYYENVSDGLLINLKKYAYTLYDNQEHGYRISNDDIGILANYVIPKEKLIVGNKIPFQSHNTITDNKRVPTEKYSSINNPATWESDSAATLHVPSQAYVLIEKNKITVQFVFQINFGSNYHNAFLDIQSITPYRK